MFKKRVILILLFYALAFLGWNQAALAGFGISPPYVKSDRLNPGSHYEQEIVLLRSEADEELEAQITVNAPDIGDWLSINQGLNFPLPKDQLRTPMTVIVDVPADAPVGSYTGHINIRIAPKERSSGGVAIALGARVDIDLQVTKDTFPDFKVRLVRIPDFEALKKPWSWRFFAWFFHRIHVVMNIENTGNVAVAPTKVQLDVFDLTEKKELELLTDTTLEKIPPFASSKKITASFPTKLGAGQYWGKVKIYKDNDIVRNDKIAFTIAEPGALENYSSGLGIWPWTLLAILLTAGLIIILILIKLKFWQYLYKFLYLILWPVRYIYRQLAKLFKNINKRFWRLMHKKAAKYQVDDKDKT